MQKGSRVGIVCCSDGMNIARQREIELLRDTLEQMNLVPVFSEYIYAKDSVYSGTGQERAKALMEFYTDDSIRAIYDISGGDLANDILPYLEFDVIRKNHKFFWGYSDLTTVINAIYARTNCSSVLYQVRNLLYDHGDRQRADFCHSLSALDGPLFSLKTAFEQGDRLQGTVVGGNIRCLLKLAGTCYWPDMQGKVLLLESCGGTVARMNTYLSQLEQMGVFAQIRGILLGTFTEMEKAACRPTMSALVRRFVGTDMPIVTTKDIGHGTDAKAIVIGREIDLYR